MSLETWKAEFYPKKANETTPEEALDHSLQKWLGLLPENLTKHNVTLMELDGFMAVTDGSIRYTRINANTCALCHHFHDGSELDSDELEDPSPQCRQCSLAKEREGFACDSETDEEMDEERRSPWHAFYFDNDPQPMIYWLKRTKENRNA